VNLFDLVPQEWRGWVPRCDIDQNRAGHSGSLVFRLTAPDHPVMYLKIRAVSEGGLIAEKHRLEWLQGLLPVPSVLDFRKNGAHEFLLMSEIRGVPSYHHSLRHDIPSLMAQLASGLRMIHQLDIDRCPFHAPLHERLEAIRHRGRDGFAEGLVASVPRFDDLVVCHGDYSMPNVIMQDGRVSGFIDLGQVGVADRYVDLIAVRKTLRYNGFPAECFTLFIKAYGLDVVDEEKLRFYELLDYVAWDSL
jgi:aminoglycoside phosphotransferase